MGRDVKTKVQKEKEKALSLINQRLGFFHLNDVKFHVIGTRLKDEGSVLIKNTENGKINKDEHGDIKYIKFSKFKQILYADKEKNKEVIDHYFN